MFPSARSPLARIVLVVCVLGTGGADALAQSGKPPRRDNFGDALPQGALYRIGTNRLQHRGEVLRLAASDDGKLLAGIDRDGTLSVWDVATGREVHHRPGEARDGWLAFMPNSTSLVFDRNRDFSSPYSAGRLCLVDVASGKLHKLRARPSWIRCAAIDPDGKVVTAVQDKSAVPWIRRWELLGKKVLGEWQFKPVSPAVSTTYISFWLSADGKVLASAEADGSDTDGPLLRLHEVATGKELRRWHVAAPDVLDIAFTRDGKFAVLSSRDSSMHVFDVVAAREIRRWQADPDLNPAHSYVHFHLAMAPDDNSVISTGPSGMIRWDWRTGKKLRSYPGTKAPIVFLQGGKTMAVQGPASTLRILDTATGKDLCPLPRPAPHVAFSADGRLFAWSEGGAIILGDARTGAELRRWAAHDDAVGAIAFAPDGKRVASAGADARVRLWDVNTLKQIRAMPHALVRRLVFAPDGRHLASVQGYDEEICLWDVGTGVCRRRWKGADRTAFDPRLRVVAIADRAKHTLHVAEMVDGKNLRVLPAYQELLSCTFSCPSGSAGVGGWFSPMFSPDGRLLLAGHTSGQQCVWNVATGKQLAPRLDGKEFVFGCMAFSPDSSLLAVARSDCVMCLLSTKTGAVLRTLGQGDLPMTAPPVFTADGRTLVTANGACVQMWEVATGGELCRHTGLVPPVRIHDYDNSIEALVLSGDQRSVAAVPLARPILVWDLTRLARGASLPPEKAWAELANASGAEARRAIESLTAVPADALALLRERLPPVPAPDAKQLARWIANLGSDDFDERQTAMAALDRLAEVPGAELRQALAVRPALEARRRIEELLRKHNPHTLPPAALRVVRAVQAIEMIGTPEARSLLQSLARGASGARLTREARAALERLERSMHALR